MCEVQKKSCFPSEHSASAGDRLDRAVRSLRLMLPLLMASALAFDAACPCIDRPESASVKAAGMWSDGLNCSLVTWPGAEPSKAIQCIPEAYGWGCGAWDSQLEPFCALPQSDPPAFCQQSWCWVNATECRSSAVTMARSQMFPDLHFSYAT